MSEGLNWLLKFQDAISGPARVMKGSVASLSSEFDKLQKAIGAAEGVDANKFLADRQTMMDGLRKSAREAGDYFKKNFNGPGNGLDFTAVGNRGGAQSNLGKIVQGIGEAFGPKASAAVLDFSSKIVDVDTALGKFGLSLEGVVAGFASFAATGAAAAAVAFVVAGGLVFAGAKMVVNAMAFRESSTLAFKTILKSQTAAEDTYKRALATADFLGKGPEETVRSFNSLLAKGFSVNEVDSLVRGMADLQAINPTANLERLTLAISQIKGKGKLSGQELLQLAENGVSTTDVMNELAKSLGKSTDEVRKLQEAGKITGEQGIAAIMASIRSATGKGLGEAARGRSQTIGGLLEQLQGRPQRLLMDLELGNGAGAVKGFLTNLNDLLSSSSEAGKRLQAVVGSGVGDMFTALFGNLSGPEGAKRLEAAVLGVVGFLEQAVVGLTSFFGGFGSALAGSLGLASTDLASMSSADRQAALAALGTKMREMGSALGYLVGVIGGAVVQFASALGTLSTVVSTIFTVTNLFGPLFAIPGQIVTVLGGSFTAAGKYLATAIINGLTGGLYSGVSAVLSAGAQLAGAAVQGAAGPKGIDAHSPSKKFDQLAGFATSGFTRRLERDKSVPSAMARMMGAPVDEAVSAARSGGGGGGSGGGNTYNIASLVINAPSGDAKSIRDEFEGTLLEIAEAA